MRTFKIRHPFGAIEEYEAEYDHVDGDVYVSIGGETMFSLRDMFIDLLERLELSDG